jgi:UDP-N-acetylmuramyl pentapeptide phosphotransferase/UDP-N-acetylglucosamine-1-phosphate transferase
LGLAAAGALAGFLVWNMSPIRVFLGNGGAYAAGILLAALAADTSRTGDWQSFLATGVCLGVLALELILTVGRRLFSSGKLVMGDRDHSYDILSRRLGSRMAVTLGFWGLGIAAAGLGVIVIRLPLPLGATLIAVLGALSLSVGSWLWAAERRAVRRSP